MNAALAVVIVVILELFCMSLIGEDEIEEAEFADIEEDLKEEHLQDAEELHRYRKIIARIYFAKSTNNSEELESAIQEVMDLQKESGCE